MSSVVERLIESWLDSQTERRYQNAFIQMLVSDGWSVLHNTRHSSMELGKDVVARSPEGELYAFQLKGNPGSRLTMGEAHKLVPQIGVLTQVALPKHFRKGTERHRAVLVTNGEIDEDVQSMLGTLAEQISDLHPASKFEWWGRGELLSRFIVTAGKVWPTTLEGNRALLNLMAADGEAFPELTSFSEVLRATCPRSTLELSGPAITSGLSAVLLIAEVAKSRWYEAENHYALYQISVQTTVYASQFIKGKPKRLAAVMGYATTILGHAADLLSEAQNTGFEADTTWTAGNVLDDVDIMWHRRNLVAECAAILLLAPEGGPNFDVAYARSLAEASIFQPKVWGEGAVPSTLVRYWSIYKWGGISSELALATILAKLIDASRERLKDVSPPASPYYNFTECWARLVGAHWMTDGAIFEESFAGRLWSARTMLYMLAKRNLKGECKQLWPAFSDILHESVVMRPDYFFDTTLSDEAELVSKTYVSSTWEGLLKEAKAVEDKCTYLTNFEALPWVVAAYVAIVPYRAWEPVLMWLDRKLCKTWY